MGRAKVKFSEYEIEAINRAKRHMAYVIRQCLANTNHYMQHQMSRHLQICHTTLSRIEKCDIEGLTFNQLFRILARLKPGFRILVATDAPKSDEPPPKVPIPDKPSASPTLPPSARLRTASRR